MATLEELQALYDELRLQSTNEAKILSDILRNEIKRRSNSGRPATSKLTRKEQNRLAQQRHRAKRKQLDK